MNNIKDPQKEGQEVVDDQGKLRTLMQKFALTLKRLPHLKNQIEGSLQEDLDVGYDNERRIERLESNLRLATDWLLDFDLLPPAVREAPNLVAIMKAGINISNSENLPALVKRFREIKIAAAQSVQQARTLTALKYVDNSDGTMTDVDACLMWKRQPESGSYTCKKAMENFGGEQPVNFGRYADWRLPTSNELKTLILAGCSPAICSEAFPDSLSRPFFSSSTAGDGPGFAMVVSFDDGTIHYASSRDRNLKFAVRLVRGIPY